MVRAFMHGAAVICVCSSVRGCASGCASSGNAVIESDADTLDRAIGILAHEMAKNLA